MPNLTGQICLITGANTGLGQALAQLLAQHQATVILACRNWQKGEAARAAIIEATGNKRIDLFTVDLMSQASIRQLAGEVSLKYPRLHLLINNAGAMFHQRTLSPDDIEATLAVNHLAPFLLAHALRDLLNSGAPARVLNIVTRPIDNTSLYLEDLQFAKRLYIGVQAYSEAKLANIMVTAEMGRRWQHRGVMVNSVHPGWFRSNLGGAENPNVLQKLLGVAQAFLPTPEQAAARVFQLATAPEFKDATSKYFDEKAEIALLPDWRDPIRLRRLWYLTEQFTGLNNAITEPKRPLGLGH